MGTAFLPNPDREPSAAVQVNLVSFPTVLQRSNYGGAAPPPPAAVSLTSSGRFGPALPSGPLCSLTVGHEASAIQSGAWRA